MNTFRSTDEMTTVTAFVRSAQSGDHMAFGQLVERFEHMVYSAALQRLGNDAEAQELCQDVFLKAWQKLHQLQNPICFGGWLRSITRRMAINRMLRSGPDIPTEPETIASCCIERQTPFANLMARERSSQVRAGLARLRTMDRDTLMAFYVCGQSLTEMSDAFDAPIGTIKRRLHVARKRLAKEVEELVAV
tara:strand:+ start:409 stop:981 length:573 start_codon:yes stop_codon:yes gene_type:complete